MKFHKTSADIHAILSPFQQKEKFQTKDFMELMNVIELRHCKIPTSGQRVSWNSVEMCPSMVTFHEILDNKKSDVIWQQYTIERNRTFY